jgi:hypothetical protein
MPFRQLPAADTLRMIVSHFIQVYQMGIARGDFAAAGRAVYELSVNEETVPNLDAEAALLLWADRIVKGDPRGVPQFSEAPMAMPAAPANGASSMPSAPASPRKALAKRQRLRRL